MPWLLRVAWVLLPFTVGPALERALDDASGPVQWVAAVGLWLAWAAVLAATLVTLPLSLTAVRAAAPAALAAAVAAALDGEPDALAVGTAAIVTVVAFAPGIAEHFVNGPAYGDERRYLLRVPGLLLLGPLELAWALGLAGLATGPLLLAAHQWIWGTLAVVVGVPAALVAFRSLHVLSRRWAVFVPAGFVLHDPMALVDPVLFRRSNTVRLGPAPAGTGALDLTQRSLGLAVQLDLEQPVALVVAGPTRRTADTVETSQLLFTPTRPGALLADAARRRLPVG